MKKENTCISEEMRGKVNRALREVVEDISSLGYSFKARIRADVLYLDSVRTYGKCRFDVGNDEIQIYLSKYLVYTKDMSSIYSTLCHEVCHAVSGTKGHGKEWKEVARNVGAALGVTIQRCDNRQLADANGVPLTARAAKMKYKLTCKDCGKEYYYLRMGKVVKNPERYCCGHCHGKLELTVL